MDDSGIKKITNFLDAIIKNKEMWIMIIAFAVVIMLVYFIRRLSVEHAWTIAIVVGGIADMLILLVGELVIATETSISIGVMIIMSLLSIAIVYVLHFMILSVDYSRTEFVQFEDDEYYYYVKAVPKINVVAPEKTVKKINKEEVGEETQLIDADESRRRNAKAERPRKTNKGEKPVKKDSDRPSAKKRAPKAKSSKVPGNTEHLLLTQSLEKELNLDKKKK